MSGQKKIVSVAQCLILLFVGALTAHSTNAAVITIDNADFENGGAPGGSNLATVDSWNEENAGQVFINNEGLTYSPEADRMLYLNAANAAANQDLGHNWSSSETYTLDLTAAEFQWKIAGAGDAFRVQLRQTDGTVLWDSGAQNLDGTVSGTPGNVSYTGSGHLFNWVIDASTFAGAGVVENSELNIRIAQTGGNPWIDDVALSFEGPVVPAPAALPAGLLLLTAIGLRRRTR